MWHGVMICASIDGLNRGTVNHRKKLAVFINGTSHSFTPSPTESDVSQLCEDHENQHPSCGSLSSPARKILVEATQALVKVGKRFDSTSISRVLATEWRVLAKWCQAKTAGINQLLDGVKCEGSCEKLNVPQLRGRADFCCVEVVRHLWHTKR